MSEAIFGPSEGLFDVGLPSLSGALSLGGLLGPVVFSDFLIGEPTRGAPLILDVISFVPASPAEGVDFGVSLTEGLCSLSLDHAL